MMQVRSLSLVVVLAGVMLAACGSSAKSTSSTTPTSALPSTAGTPTTANLSTQSGSPSTQSSGANVSGTWSGPWQRTSPIPGQGTNTFTLQQAGDKVTGTVDPKGSACLTTSPIAGTVQGDAITLHLSANGKTADYTGTISGDTMSGTETVTCPGVGTGTATWKATRG